MTGDSTNRVPAPSSEPNPAGPGEHADTTGVRVYRLRPATGLRVVGLACIGLTIPVLLELGRRTIPVLDLSVVVGVTWACVAALTAVLLVGVWLLLDRRARLRLDDEGFVSRTTYGLRTARASWHDIGGVRRLTATAGPVLVVEAGGEQPATILPRYLDGDLNEIEHQIRARLNTAHGYRPLSQPSP